MRPVVTLTQTLETCFHNLMMDVGTSIPAVVLSFNSSEQTAEIQISIQGVDEDGTIMEQFPILSVPVFFQGSSDYSIQHELKAGDSGIAIFSQRCIDNWLTKGSGYPPNLYRFHDINDAMFLAGLRPLPKKIASFSNEGISIAKNSGGQYVRLNNDGSIEIKSNGTNPVIKIDGVDFLTHKHDSGTLATPTESVTLGNTGEVNT